MNNDVFILIFSFICVFFCIFYSINNFQTCIAVVFENIKTFKNTNCEEKFLHHAGINLDIYCLLIIINQIFAIIIEIELLEIIAKIFYGIDLSSNNEKFNLSCSIIFLSIVLDIILLSKLCDIFCLIIGCDLNIDQNSDLISEKKFISAKDFCIICMSDIKEDKKYLHCGHVFHVICIYKWTHVKNNCPTCRQENYS